MIVNTTTPAGTDDAAFRAWCQKWHDTFASFGLVQTADTGQINLATVLRPTATATVAGYEIWRFADALQATKPVFIKIGYGSGNTVTTSLALYPSIGTGTDGASNLTGVLMGQRSLVTTVAQASFALVGSGDVNRLALIWNPSTNIANAPNPSMLLAVERTKDANGNDTGDGLVWCMAAPSGAFGAWGICNFAVVGGTVVASVQSGSLPIVSLSSGGHYTNFGANLAASPWIAFMGAMVGSLNFVAFKAGDVPLVTQQAVQNLGGVHNYYVIGVLPTGDTSVHAHAIRYE